MTFDEVLTQVLALLQQEKRISYRALKLRFDIDDDYIEGLKDELIYAKHLAVDEDSQVLVWTGNIAGTTKTPAQPPQSIPSPLPQATPSVEAVSPVVPSSFDAFVSYARADDQQFLSTLLSRLPAHLRLWYDRESLLSRGLTFDGEIRRAIESSDRLILFFGPGVAASDYVLQEWAFADDLGIPVIPVLRAGDYGSLPDALRHYHAVDARAPRTAEDVAAELTRLLIEPVLRLGPCYDFPFRIPSELPREPLQDMLWDALGLDRQRPRDAGRAQRAAALHGLPGAGKSTAAAAFGRSIRCRRAFPEGIFWLRCGRNFQALVGARSLISRIAPGSGLPDNDSGVQQALAEALFEKGVLVILDDVHDASAVAPFVQAAGPGGRALVTCLDPEVATVLGAARIEVERLDDESARRLLRSWVGDSLPEEADSVLAACDGLPFALAITGAMVRDGIPWARVVQWFESRRLDLIEKAFPGYEQHGTLLRAIAASFDALASRNQQAAAAWVELAALHRGAVLTEQIIFRLWGRPGGLSVEDAGTVLSLLERRLLIQARNDAGVKKYLLHKLLDDFIRLKCPNSIELQSALVESYRGAKGDRDWSELEDDGYVFDNLLGHFEALELNSELVRAVNRGWVRKQFNRTGDVGQALDDVKLAMRVAARPPVDFARVGELALLSGQIVSTIRSAPRSLIGAVAAIGDSGHALRWAADQPDPDKRFDGLVTVAEQLIASGQIALARKVVDSAAELIPMMGKVIETGILSGLTALNAVHAIVHFPWTDQWEGTTDENVALARIPLDAVGRLAWAASRVDALHRLALVRHPFWELYAHLIPMVAVEQLADRGARALAAALLDAIPQHQAENDSDPFNAAAYRRVVATAAVGRFEEAIAAIESLNSDYRSVARRGVAKHLASANRMPEAVVLLRAMNDALAWNEAIADAVEIAIAAADPESCHHLGEYLVEMDSVIPATWLLAAGYKPEFGMLLLDRAPQEELMLGVGARLGIILANQGRMDLAISIAQRLVPAAERLMGQQWYAPETVNVQPLIAQAAGTLLALLARTGQPLPEGVIPLSLIIEGNYDRIAVFKLELITHLTMAQRFSDALELANISGASSGRAYCLATVLSLGRDSIDADLLKSAAQDLLRALETAPADPELDLPLAAAMRTLFARGLFEESDRLCRTLLSKPGLRSAVGAWAFERGRAGDAAAVRNLVAQLFRVPDTAATPEVGRAMMIAALASRNRDVISLPDVERILSDVRTAAGSLDIVFEVVGAYIAAGMTDRAAAFSTRVPAGKAGEVADTLEREGSATFEGVTYQELAAVFLIRAVAASGMALGAVRRGAAEEAGQWLEKAHNHVRMYLDGARVAGIGEMGKYIAAAELAVTGESAQLTEPGMYVVTAWLLWEYGNTAAARQLALHGLNALGSPLDGLGQMVSADTFERRSGCFTAARIGLASLLAVQFASEGESGKAQEMVSQEETERTGYGWSALTLGEQSEVYAFLAIANHACGDLDSALQHLRAAIEPAPALAARGEMRAFQRLVQALTQILPADNAARFWVQWVVAAAAKGARETMILLSILIRHVREEDIARVRVEPEGQMIRKEEVDEAQRERSSLYEFFGMSGGGRVPAGCG